MVDQHGRVPSAAAVVDCLARCVDGHAPAVRWAGNTGQVVVAIDVVLRDQPVMRTDGGDADNGWARACLLYTSVRPPVHNNPSCATGTAPGSIRGRATIGDPGNQVGNAAFARCGHRTSASLRIIFMSDLPCAARDIGSNRSARSRRTGALRGTGLAARITGITGYSARATTESISSSDRAR